MYIRMTFRAVDVYELLEPLLKDYRKIRYRDMGTSHPSVRRVRPLTSFQAAIASLLSTNSSTPSSPKSAYATSSFPASKSARSSKKTARSGRGRAACSTRSRAGATTSAIGAVVAAEVGVGVEAGRVREATGARTGASARTARGGGASAGATRRRPRRGLGMCPGARRAHGRGHASGRGVVVSLLIVCPPLDWPCIKCVALQF